MLGPNAEANIPYVTIKLCAAGTTTCQTIDHVLVDTGSTGLRIERGALNSTMLSALTVKTGNSGQLGECYQYLDGYVWGSVRSADMTIGGEQVAGLNLMVIGDNGNFASVPSACSSGGGSSLDTVSDFGANGVIGVGLSSIDCGTFCNSASNSYYYDCTSTGCTQMSLSTALQLPNPVAQMAAPDNNGTVVDLPAPNPAGQVTLNGTLYFGVETETNNALAGDSVIMLVNNSGYITANYNGTTLAKSFIDSGTNFLSFTDSAITACTGQLKGFYCPATPLTITPVLNGTNGLTKSASLPVVNVNSFADADAVLPGLAGDPNAFSNVTPISGSFDFGLPFFFGRRVYTTISGKRAAGQTQPFFAF